MKAITIKNPWAELIVHAGKNIENRTWPTSYRGLIFIHASKKLDPDEIGDAVYFCDAMGIKSDAVTRILSPNHGYECGGIIGQAMLVDCVSSSTSPWFSGPFGFVLEEIKPVPFIPCRGSLGLWEPPIIKSSHS
jgi:hypothetical protein